MPVNIDQYLTLIAGAPEGDIVKEAIANAMSTLDKNFDPGLSINVELDTIKTGVYGIDIREAIRMALLKLSLRTADSSGGAPNGGDWHIATAVGIGSPCGEFSIVED